MNGEQLKQRREFTGLNRVQLATELGLSPQIISAWENGTRPIPKRRVAAIKRVTESGTEEWDDTGVLVLSWR